MENDAKSQKLMEYQNKCLESVLISRNFQSIAVVNGKPTASTNSQPTPPTKVVNINNGSNATSTTYINCTPTSTQKSGSSSISIIKKVVNEPGKRRLETNDVQVGMNDALNMIAPKKIKIEKASPKSSAANESVDLTGDDSFTNSDLAEIDKTEKEKEKENEKEKLDETNEDQEEFGENNNN